MSLRDDILSSFSGAGRKDLFFLPDLSLWYEWHHTARTLPRAWYDLSLPQVAQAMGAAVWMPVTPWSIENPGVDIVTTEDAGERVIRSETSAGTLTARWRLGPDGDWWQTEYPVKKKEDLTAVLEIARARTYVLDAADLKRWEAAVGDSGVVAIEIPRRPFSDLLHQFLGWSEGLLFLREPLIQDINDALDAALQRLVREVALLPSSLVLSPDNLDGQFISPRAFDAFLADSYRLTSDVLHGHDKRLVVHIGGPVKRLLPLLVAAGVDAFEGVCGPPQSDLRLTEAREIAGPGPILWGGIPQDFLLSTHDAQEFEERVKDAAREARSDGRAILGIADRVPANAVLERLTAIPNLIG